ncbi:MAG: fused MFS/spermidine synthase [Verrucomicrobiota bacterium]
MPAFLLAIFLSAFLLFQVQPIIARYILPWYGGSPAVWTTCMLFFQVGLLTGYTYAHLLVSWLRERPKWQVGIHLGLLLVSFILLPITPPESLKPTGVESSPVGGILFLLAVTVGLPYVVISASGPLLQHWFGTVAEGKSPYRLYAISNIGSLLGLLTYPVLFEPNLRLAEQTGLWSGGYVVYGVFAAACAWMFLRSAQKKAESEVVGNGEIPPRAPWIDRCLWISLAACGSLLLLAATNQMCQDVAVVPFLWVLPLSLYLLTFVIAFDAERWYFRPFWVPFAALSIGTVVYLLNQDHANEEMHLSRQVAIYACAVFSGCMICHGEMVRLKPHPRYLTGFYLAVSLGGALGGAFVSLAAPRIFDGYWEFHFGLVAVALLGGACVLRAIISGVKRWMAPQVIVFASLWLVSIATMTHFLLKHREVADDMSIHATRGFYGVLRVYETEKDTVDHMREMYHGRINHGRQFLHPDYRWWPISYYTEESGPGTFFEWHPDGEKPKEFGVIGLGIGTLATYANPGDTVRMYEINSQVEDIARDYFTYLEDCPGDVSVVLGDARIVLEHELARGDNQQFDALFVDAFSGDSIPIHLLTKEAFELYFEHLKEDGVLAVHITNLHLDLSAPVRTIAESLGKETMQIIADPDYWYAYYSRWVFISDNKEVLDAIGGSGRSTPWDSEEFERIHWADDYCNLLQVINW